MITASPVKWTGTIGGLTYCGPSDLSESLPLVVAKPVRSDCGGTRVDFAETPVINTDAAAGVRAIARELGVRTMAGGIGLPVSARGFRSHEHRRPMFGQ